MRSKMVAAIQDFFKHNPILNNASLGLCAIASFEMGCRAIITREIGRIHGY